MAILAGPRLCGLGVSSAMSSLGPASIVEVAAVVVEDGEINAVGGIVSFTTDVVVVVRVNPR